MKEFDPVKIERYVYTTDWWCPNYGEHLVSVAFRQLWPSMDWRVSVGKR